MTKEQLASELQGMHYQEEIPDELIEVAKKSNLVIVYGQSDDLMELEGAITAEGNCHRGNTFFIDKDGLLPDRDNVEDDDELEMWFARKKTAKQIIAVWHPNGVFSWSYKTSIPHATFDIIDEGDVYCKGIVFELADL